MSSQSSPVCLSKPNFRPSADSIDIQEEDEDEDEAFIDASEELPRALSPTDSNNSFESAKGFGRRSFIVSSLFFFFVMIFVLIFFYICRWKMQY